MTMTRRGFAALGGSGLVAATGLMPRRARAARPRLAIAEQFGVGFLPLYVLRDQGLIEKHGRERGLDIEVVWAKLSGGAALNEALLSGSIDVASGGVAPMLTIWDRTRGRGDVRAIAPMTTMPYYLLSSNPAVRRLADFTGKDRIAVPSVGVSIQSRLLQMAAEQAFGEGQHGKLDALTVTLPHGEATAAMLAGGTEINAHFASPPFQEQQLQNTRIHKVLSSHDILGGPATSIVLWGTGAFNKANPDVQAAFIAALREATAFIKADPAAATATYIKVEGSKLDPAFLRGVIDNPEISFNLTPSHTAKFARFMHKIGAIKNEPKDWRDYFFDGLHEEAGS